MCGRFALDATAADLARQFEVEADKPIESRYNIAPSQHILTVVSQEKKRSLVAMKWGLIPGWVKNLDNWKSNLINARAETVTEKPSFRSAFDYFINRI
jgi:putative SOS response-associated peptidase YedK